MSEKTFAVGSVVTAVICGVFFYPPPPPARGQQLAHNPVRQQVRVRPADTRERDWWRKKLAQFTAPRR